MKKKSNYILPIIIVLIVILVIVTIKFYQVYKTNKEIKKQQEFVISYLNSEYPDYNFEITETEESCWPYNPFDCEDIYVNKVLLKSHNIEFEIQVTKPDLSIYYDEFEYMYEEIK